MARSLSSGNNMNNGSAVRTAPPISMVCWFKPTTLASTQALLVIDNNSTTDRFILDTLITTGGVRALATASNSNTASESTAPVTVGAWNHCCAVFASSTARRSFMNGANKGTDAVSKVPAGMSRTRIGQWSTGAASVTGDVAEMAVWNLALSDAEVALLATGVSPYEVQRSGLVAYWPLLGLASPETDIMGSFNMTLVGSPAQAAHPFVFYSSNRFARRRLVA